MVPPASAVLQRVAPAKRLEAREVASLAILIRTVHNGEASSISVPSFRLPASGTAMVHTLSLRRSRRFLLPAIFLLMATSRPTATKELEGVADQVPDGLSVLVAPTGRFGENTNNQGCFAEQRLDLWVEAQVQNDRAAAVIIRSGETQILIDGEPWPLAPLTYTVRGEQHVRPYEDFEIAPGGVETVSVFSYGFMPREHLDTADRIEVSMPLGEGALRFVFEGVRAVEAVKR
jgi:hypothetical protein